MIFSQRSPLWPYLLVLTGLFLLSLAVPRGWQTDSESDELRQPDRQRAQVRLRASASTVAIVRPSSETVAAPLAVPLTADVGGQGSWVAADQQQVTADASQQASNFIEPLAESVAKKIADFRRFGGLQNSAHNSGASAGSVGVSAGGANESHQPTGEMTPQQRTDAIASAYWPVPKSLFKQLDRLAENTQCQAWAEQAENGCLRLCQASPSNPQQASAIVQQLQALEQQAETLDRTLKNDKAAAEFRRARYALTRHLAVWNVAFTTQRQSAVYADVPSAQVQRERLSESLATADAWVRSIPYADAWRKYLLLDNVAQLADANQSFSSEQAQRVAQQALARLCPEQMTDLQRQVLQDHALQGLVGQLRTWTNETVDVRDVLANIEQYEGSGLPSDARLVTAAMRKLDLSAVASDRQLAQELDEHYRNANLRIALAADLFNRLVPEQPVASGVVNENILGAVVNGSSTTNTQLTVKLIPDPLRLHLWINARGTVESSTEATSGPATFDNDGRSNFLVHKAVIVDRQGLWLANAVAEANTDSQLTGVRTNYDGMLLFGAIARNIAISQHDAMRGAAEQQTDEKVAAQAIKSVDAEVKEHLTEAERAVRKNLYDPLAKLGVAPEPVTLETSAQRLTMRLRIAGQNQLGGHTARPQALSDSFASAQVHESALNNILDQLQLAGRTFTLPELFRHVAEQMSWTRAGAPADLSADVRVTFAANDPVRVRCQDGTVQLTLAVAELQERGHQWSNFLVTANYEPQIEDLHVRLVRQGPIELGGDGAKGQPELALRGIFSKLFPRERSFELIPAAIADNRNLSDLCISQCVVEDGWLALSLGPQRDNSDRSAMGRSTMER